MGAIHAALVNLVDQADKTALEALLEEASKLTEGKYTAASWEKLENAKEAAQAVLENADATPQEVEEAYDALLDALVGLELIPVDKSNLKVAIDLAKPIVAEADRYVATTIEGLSELLSEAEALYADEEATQEKVDEMAQRLLSASSQARLKANKTALKEAVEQAEGIDLSQYTEASAKVFSAALAKANGILADESLTEDDQALVDQAASALRTAINGLVKEGASDPDVSKPGESSQPGEPEEPSTGDSSPVLLIALFAGISALAALLLHKRRTQA